MAKERANKNNKEIASASTTKKGVTFAAAFNRNREWQKVLRVLLWVGCGDGAVANLMHFFIHAPVSTLTSIRKRLPQ